MSRNHSYAHSPYASRRPAPRWPLLLALTVVLALAGAGSIAVGGGLFEPANVDQGAPPEAPVAAEQVPATTDPGTDPAPAADAALGVPGTETPPPTGTVAVPPVTGGAELAQAATAPAASPTAAPTATAVGPPPAEVAQTWAERWSAGDFAGLYELLSAESQDAISEEDFVGRYTDIGAAAGLSTVTATVSGKASPEGQVPLEVVFESALVGKITEENVVPLVRDGDGWRVAWTPSLIFRDLDDGCIDPNVETTGRGRILSADGEVLAEDKPLAEVGIVPAEVEDEAAMLRTLRDLTKMTDADIRAAYEDRDENLYWKIGLFPGDQTQRLVDGLADVAGVRVKEVTGRSYPAGPLVAHVTGYVSMSTAEDIAADPTVAEGDWIGRSGIEAGANDLLTGRPGGRLAIVECASRAPRKVIAERDPTPPKDVTLTIDMGLQRETDASLAKVEGEERGSAVVIDPQSGAVLAMVSHPTYDPNWFVLGNATEQEWARVNDEKLTPLINRAAESAYPTGSIFKAITTAAAMVELGYDEDTTIDCPQTFTLGQNAYDDWVSEYGAAAQGPLTLHDALVRSCNTVFFQIGQELDDKDEMLLPDMARAFGLGAPTDIPYLPEVSGTVPDPAWKLETIQDYWATGDALLLAIGQGYLQATPLQMANVYATIANGGTLLQPYIVDQTVAPGGGAEQVGERTEMGKLPLSRGQVDQLHSALRDQTSNAIEMGSAKVFGPSYPWPIAGKTGTAEDEGDRQGRPHSWFAAFGPYGETATIASCVMVENIGEGGKFAAPVTKGIYDAYRKSDLAGSDP